MSGILDLLNSAMGETLINGASRQLGQEKQQTTSALSTALPLILGAMKNNASTPNGAAGLLSALSNSKHSGDVLNNIGSILGSNSIDTDVMEDGAEILKHVFGGKEQNIATVVSKSSGIDLSGAMNILKIAAPMVMGYLGNQKRQNNISDQNGLGNLLSGMLGGNEKNQRKQQNLVSSLLDVDGDGSVLDDIAGMVFLKNDNSKKKGPLGSLLGGVFGGK